METARMQRVMRGFCDALEVPAGGRDEFVATRLADDAEVADRVRRLLDRHATIGSFLVETTRVDAERPPAEPLDLPAVGPIGSGVLDLSDGAERALGHLVAGRYRLAEVLGSGGFGAVFGADDLLAGRRVAVKLLREQPAGTLEVFRREVAALRHLRLPGVVHLLDEGREDGHPFIVMERVHGAPFPGVEVLRWRALEPIALTLLDALGRIHWAGVVHRDLKPANVLVDADGRLTILDLGIAVETGATDRRREGFFGTPLYAAPELLTGRRATVASDLYAVGVMLYQALVGEVPHAPGSKDGFVDRRTGEPLESIAGRVAELPLDVAETIDSLLSPGAADRPRSAFDAAAALRGRGRARTLPRLGSSETLELAQAAVREGRSIRVAGRAGSGRTRFLRELEEQLQRSGTPCLTILESAAPFEGLLPLLDLGEARAAGSVDAVRALLGERLRARLAGGLVVLCDGPESVDRWTAALLGDASEFGCVVRTDGPSESSEIRLEPLGEDDLRALFAGHDRLFHARTDAADELRRRTGGVARHVEREVEAWVAGGIARWEGERLVLDRSALERLTGSGLSIPTEPAPRAQLDDSQLELLTALEILARPTAIDLLASLLERQPWQVEAEFDELAAADLVQRGGDGRLTPVVSAIAVSGWDDLRVAQFRSAAADLLPPGASGRLLQLIASNRLEEVPAEASLVAGRALCDGRVRAAWNAVEEGLAALRANGDDPAGERALLHTMLEVGLAEAAGSRLDQVLYHLARAADFDDRVATLEDHARAALLAAHGDGRRALRLLGDTAPGDRLAQAHHSIRTLAGRYASLDDERAAVAASLLWSRRVGDREARARSSEQLGWLRYREGNFAVAAALHERTARLTESGRVRLSALLNAASALMEDHRLDEALALAEEGLAAAVDLRHPIHEARATWQLRTLAYRRCEDLQPDLDLVAAAGELDFPNIEALICLNEAAVAWRGGDDPTARRLALHASDTWGRAGRRWGQMLAGALAHASGAAAPPGDRSSLRELARTCPIPGMAIQALGLLGPDVEPGSCSVGGVIDKVLAAIPPDGRAVRREVLSVQESLRRLGRNEL